MTRACDHPIDIAMLRALMQAPDEAFTEVVLERELVWLGETPLANPKLVPARLRRLVSAGLVAEKQRPGRLPVYQFVRGSSVQMKTGGIDPLAVDAEELLEAFSWRQARRPDYDPKAWKREQPGKTENERALTQCSSPWQYGQRLRRL